MFEDVKYAHFTVPHSGTRYINYAVCGALGTNIYQVSNLRAYKNTHERVGVDAQFMFCHIGPKWQDWIEQVAAEPHIKTWITVREPIGTWSTHWGHIWEAEQNEGKVDYRALYDKLGQLRGQYETLRELLPKVDYVHRVDEDPISSLGDCLGLELKEHDNTFSRPTPMKRALLERDLSKIEGMCQGHDFWKAFHDYLTPDFKDLWEDLGYDIWWYNGERNAA